MEIILRGPRLAGGVWVPVLPGWAARLIVDGESPAFLPAAAWSPSRRAFPNTWTAYGPLGLSLWQVILWPRARSPLNSEHSSLLLAALKWLPSVQAAEPTWEAKGVPVCSLDLFQVGVKRLFTYHRPRLLGRPPLRLVAVSGPKTDQARGTREEGRLG